MNNIVWVVVKPTFVDGLVDYKNINETFKMTEVRIIGDKDSMGDYKVQGTTNINWFYVQEEELFETKEKALEKLKEYFELLMKGIEENG